MQLLEICISIVTFGNLHFKCNFWKFASHMQLLEMCSSNATFSRMSKAKNNNWNESKSSSPQIRKGWWELKKSHGLNPQVHLKESSKDATTPGRTFLGRDESWTSFRVQHLFLSWFPQLWLGLELTLHYKNTRTYFLSECNISF